jgi:hypothetical protein
MEPTTSKTKPGPGAPERWALAAAVAAAIAVYLAMHGPAIVAAARKALEALGS